MRFATPALAWAACAVPLVVVALHLYDRARRASLLPRLGDLPVLSKVIASASPGRRVVKDVIVAIALVLVVIAAARPQLAGKRKVEIHGLDLVIAVDVSKSMLVDDVGPTMTMTDKKLPTSRLERARELAVSVIDELPGDRIAPIVFAGAAAHFPLTEDHEVAAHFLYDLGPAAIPQGSNLAEVFRVARCLLRPDLYEDLGCSRIGQRGHGGDPLGGESLDPKAKHHDDDANDEVVEEKVERGKAIVIVTDGGESDPETTREVTVARELGVAVFIVGVGTTQGGVVYDTDPSTGRRTVTPKRMADGTTVTSKREDRSMRALAEAGGDARRYIIASERGEVDPMPIVQALQAVNRGLATKQVKDVKDVFQPFLFAGFMLLVIEAGISTRRRRDYPEAR